MKSRTRNRLAGLFSVALVVALTTFKDEIQDLRDSQNLIPN